MRCVLVLASGASWESEALDRLREASGIVVLKRCVDVDDLMASAATQQADLAVVSAEAPGLDGQAVQMLRRHGVGVVAVTPATLREDAEARLARVGVVAALPETELEDLPAALLALEDQSGEDQSGEDQSGEDQSGEGAPGAVAGLQVPNPRQPQDDTDLLPSGAPPPGDPGRIVVVWGPVGAPGRTTVATAVAGELARRGRPTLLVDADPHASVAQHLGVLDQISGLLAAARAGSGGLAERLPAAARRVDDDLVVLTGLPRPERQVELRPGMLTEVLLTASESCDVVVDVGAELAPLPSLRDDARGLTLEALQVADEVVVVGAADPVGLARLAHGLVELRDAWEEAAVRVVVNRMRPTLGWSRSDVAGMVEGVTRVSSLHFLPEDRAGVDRALVAGHSVAREVGSQLAASVRELVDALRPETYAASPAPSRRGMLSRRRAGTTRQR